MIFLNKNVGASYNSFNSSRRLVCDHEVLTLDGGLGVCSVNVEDGGGSPHVEPVDQEQGRSDLGSKVLQKLILEIAYPHLINGQNMSQKFGNFGIQFLKMLNNKSSIKNPGKIKRKILELCKINKKTSGNYELYIRNL